MKGYFSSLAKQSSVSIRGGQTIGARLPETLSPLHSETVLFVDATPTTVSPVNDSQTIERNSPLAGSQHPPAPVESPHLYTQRRSTSGTVVPPAIYNSPAQPRPVETFRPAAPFESSFSMTNSPAPATENPEDPVAQLEGQALKKAGVVRVGEPESPTETKTTEAPESFSELFRRDVPDATSIPHEYLAGIREWLDSPPIEIEAGERRKTLPQSPESAQVTMNEHGQAMIPTLRDSEVPPQNEIKEFSLSIGSISIVVEEPPAPKPQVNHVPPQTPAPITAAPAAPDAFALSRRYFRGF